MVTHTEVSRFDGVVINAQQFLCYGLLALVYELFKRKPGTLAE